MKSKLLIGLAAWAIGATAVGLASAQAPEREPTGPEGRETPAQAGQAGQAAQAKGFKGQHAMEGTVQAIDEKTGKVTLETREHGQLVLHFPPPALSGVKVGDSITVQLALKTTGAGKEEKKGEPKTEPGGQQPEQPTP